MLITLVFLYKILSWYRDAGDNSPVKLHNLCWMTGMWYLDLNKMTHHFLIVQIYSEIWILPFLPDKNETVCLTWVNTLKSCACVGTCVHCQIGSLLALLAPLTCMLEVASGMCLVHYWADAEFRDYGFSPLSQSISRKCQDVTSD